MKQSGIYKITCRPNNKIYIGSAVNLNVRWNRHLSELKTNKHVNPILQNAYNKYGIDKFRFEIIEIIDDVTKLFEREQFYLNTLKPFGKYGFNITIHAQGGGNFKNHPNKKEIFEKISNTKLEQHLKVSDEHKAYLSKKLSEYFIEHPNPNKNKTLEEIHGVEKANEIKRNISKNNKTKSGVENPWYGKTHTSNAKKRLSECHVGKYFGTQNVEIIINDKSYTSYGSAAKELGTFASTIRFRCLSNDVKYINYKIKK